MLSMVRQTLLARLARGSISASLVALGWAVLAGPVAAHGPVPTDPPSAANLLFGWTFPPLPTLAILVSVVWWLWAVRRVNASHPGHPVPRRRTVAFLGGMLALGFALCSGIEAYDTTLFSLHMVQHVLLMLVAAPLIALSAPVTLLLRLSAPATRQRWILPVLHSRVIRVLSFPVVAWVFFAAKMWGTRLITSMPRCRSCTILLGLLVRRRTRVMPSWRSIAAAAQKSRSSPPKPRWWFASTVSRPASCST